MLINKINGLIGLAFKAGKVSFGTDATKEAIQKGKVKLVIVAEDASEKLKENFEFLCKKEKVDIVIYGKIEDLSKTIGKNNKAVIGIKEINLAKEIKKNINGGDIIG